MNISSHKQTISIKRYDTPEDMDMAKKVKSKDINWFPINWMTKQRHKDQLLKSKKINKTQRIVKVGCMEENVKRLIP